MEVEIETYIAGCIFFPESNNNYIFITYSFSLSSSPPPPPILSTCLVCVPTPHVFEHCPHSLSFQIQFFKSEQSCSAAGAAECFAHASKGPLVPHRTESSIFDLHAPGIHSPRTPWFDCWKSHAQRVSKGRKPSVHTRSVCANAERLAS